MNLKSVFYIISVFILISTMYSCLGNGTDYSYTSDARIKSLTVGNDSIYGVDSLKFSIENSAGEGMIFNKDSLPYGTKIKRKLVLTYSTNAAGVVNITKIDNDTATISSGDSISIPENKSANGYALHLKIYAYDGTTYKYWLKILVHQVNPDSIQYSEISQNVNCLSGSETKTILFKNQWYTFNKTGSSVSLYQASDLQNWIKINTSALPEDLSLGSITQNGTQIFGSTDKGELYTSSDAVNWTQIPTDYPVVKILGYLYPSSLNEGGLSFVSQNGSSDIFSFYGLDNTNQQYTFQYGNTVDSQFPIQNFSSLSRQVLLGENITIVGAAVNTSDTVSSVWSTTDGLTWAQLNDTQRPTLPSLTGANAFLYGNSIFVLNGKRFDGTLNKGIYESKDNGISWARIRSEFLFPSAYKNRTGASTIPDNGYFYIVGGKDSGGNVIDDIWKCFRNEMLFTQQ